VRNCAFGLGLRVALVVLAVYGVWCMVYGVCVCVCVCMCVYVCVCSCVRVFVCVAWIWVI